MKHPRLKAALLIAFLAEQAGLILWGIFNDADSGMQREVLATLKRSVNWWTVVAIGTAVALFLGVVHALRLVQLYTMKEAEERQNDRIETNQRVAELRIALTYETTAREYIEQSHVKLLDYIAAETKSSEASAKLKESFVAPTLDSVER